MPAKSKQQQKFFGVVKAMQKGDIPKKGEAGEVADDMTKKDVDKMASTKHKGLPVKIKELIRLQLNKTMSENRLTEVSANVLRSKYEKAVKKEQALSSLLLVNLEKYKAAKAKGDEKAIAKHRKIAYQLGAKKAKATTDASKAYKAYEDKISGLHEDVELQIDEDNKDGIRFDLVMSDEAYDELYNLIGRYVEDPDDVEKELDRYDDGGFDSMSNMVIANLDRDKDYEAWKKKYGIKEGVNELKTGNKINKARAKAHFKQGENIAVIDKNTGDAIRITDLIQLDAFDSKTHDFAYITESKLNEARSLDSDISNFLKTFRLTEIQNPFVYEVLKAHFDIEKRIIEPVQEMDDFLQDQWMNMNNGTKAQFARDVGVPTQVIKAWYKKLSEGKLTEATLPKFKTPYEAYNWIMGKREEALDIETEMLQTTNDIIQTQKDMEQEASPEGGPTTDRYGSVLNKLELKHRELRKQFAAIMAEIDEYDQNYM